MLRLLSDLHFRDSSSRLRRLEDLEPLLAGVDTLWLNGDTCDNQSGLPAAAVAEMLAFFRGRVPVVRFITGNHDPDISCRPLARHGRRPALGRAWRCVLRRPRALGGGSVT